MSFNINMKIIAIGDTHGRDKWKSLTNEDFDKFIFVGDYFDSRDNIDIDTQIQNFKDILEFKITHPDKVELLIGNHDFHYMNGVKEEYSGFNWHYANKISEVLQPAVDNNLINMCYVYDKWVFTHAGVTKTWAKDFDIDIDNLQESINNKFINNKDAFKFNGFSRSGDDITQSPIWVRIPSLLKDCLDNFTFVVGHSTLKEVTITEKIIAIDTIAVSGEYLIIDNNKEIVGNI